MSVTVSQFKNLVGGDWVDALEGQTMEVLNPSTGDVIAEVPRGGEGDVERAVGAAAKALPDWLEKTPKDRMEVLLGLADVMEEHGEELARLESLNVGKPMWIARDEIPVLRRQPALLRRRGPESGGQGGRRVRRAATRRSCVASRSASSPGSRPGTTR